MGKEKCDLYNSISINIVEEVAEKGGVNMSEWEKYIAYLHDWAEVHKGEEFQGCSPACYDEWRDMELEAELKGL